MTQAQFYSSKQWHKFAEALKLQRKDSDGLVYCEICGRPILKKYDCIAHHKTELNDANVNDANISLNPDNIALVHFGCHNKLHQRAADRMFTMPKREVYLVYGSPCAGKTTWVQQNANADDLILDIDRLWEAVCLSDRYNKPNRLKQNVFGLRDCLIEQISKRTGKWLSAYVIGGYPLRTDRDRMCMLLNARPIFIDESKEVCLQRAQNDDWRGYVERWFADYTE